MFGNALWAAKATAFCCMAASQIAVITPETTLAPWIPKTHKNETKNSQINAPGKLVPTTDNGLKMNCIRFGMVSIGVNEIPSRITQTSNKQKKPGNKAVNESLTAGGTLAGILIVIFLWTIQT